eukprot:CAMPEP_0118936448 /NCGR_PEP_ID=MMETSP1169-20130426/18966_1 /TAXON_ID=36882 /ORGANISM="Pyramimonas obovata, Strain CCMP722" /LENGTH=163 /DNA_ID=CAMNT_0006879715 /DNA_START=183 /DNA_END=671 /DNA_ORIENTATION=+
MNFKHCGFGSGVASCASCPAATPSSYSVTKASWIPRCKRASLAQTPLQSHRSSRSTRQRRPKKVTRLKVYALRNIDWPEALLIDAGGILFEEEKDIRRVALNSALKTQGKTKGFDEQSYREFLDSTQSLGGSTRYLDLCEGDATDADALEALETDEAVRILSG